MSINKLISIENPILDALDMLALDHDKYRPLFTTWATDAEKQIGGACALRKWEVLDICGCTALLPDDAVTVEAAILGDHKTNCGSLFSNVLGTQFNTVSRPAGFNFVVVDVGGSADSDCVFGIVPYSYQDNKLIFDQCLTATHITIQYKGYALDCNGFMKISENHVNAIAEYIQWKWLKRKENTGKSRISQGTIAERKMEWSRLCANARALDGQLTETQRETIAQMYHDPYIERGLHTGMKPNGYYGGEINY
jgi:hypothetical protein